MEERIQHIVLRGIEGGVEVKQCVFCSNPGTEIIAENELARAFYDISPVNPGHVLITPKRHIANLFDASPEELTAINQLLFIVKEILDQKFKPDGYNVGVNIGEAAGQTIFHLHYHVIPRYLGDVPNPRGGVRKVRRSSPLEG